MRFCSNHMPQGVLYVRMDPLWGPKHSGGAPGRLGEFPGGYVRGTIRMCKMCTPYTLRGKGVKVVHHSNPGPGWFRAPHLPSRVAAGLILFAVGWCIPGAIRTAQGGLRVEWWW